MHSYNFQLIDKDNYNFDLEKNKIEIVELLGKLLGFDFFKNAKINTEKFSEEETNKFIFNLFSNEEYLKNFLYYLNIYRTRGNFELNDIQFNIFKLIFCKASDYLLERNIKKIYYPLIILSVLNDDQIQKKKNIIVIIP